MSKLHSRPTQSQMKTLVELMSKDPLLCAGKFTQTFTQKSVKQKWEVIAEQLNALPGAEKSWDKWKKTWQDTRSATKTKAAAIKRHIGGTGGGPTCAIQLNDIQQDALLLMSPASVSGHSKSKESNVEFIYKITENDVTLDTNDYIIEEVADIESDDENNNHSITAPKLIAANNKRPIIAPFSPKSDIKRKMTTTARLAASNRAANNLYSISEKKYDLKAAYYAKKIKLMEDKNVIFKNLTNALTTLTEQLSKP